MASVPDWRAGDAVGAASLHHARMHLLPDRTVLANGGARVEEHRVEAALHAELYDPWSEAAKSRVPRLYHSIALLTPDGRVVTAGSNPRPRDDELRIEVFDVPFEVTGPGRLRLRLPRRRTLAPGGWYLVFAVDAGGIPSVGRWLVLG